MHQRQNTFAKSAGFAGAMFLAGALALDYWPSSSALPWLSFSEAQSAARVSNKPVFLDLYAEWCPPCKQMDRVVFPDDSVSDLLTRRFSLAKVNMDDPVWGDSLKRQFRVKAIPTYIILTPGGREIKRHVGFFEKSAFIRWLQDSSNLLVFSWQNFEKARAQAAFQEKRLLVVVTASSEDYEELSSMFDTPETRRIIDSAFVPTVLLRTNTSNAGTIAQLGSSNTQTGEVFVLDGNKEVGRFMISQDMSYNQQNFTAKLVQLSGIIPGGPPRVLAPQKQVRRIGATSSQ